MSVKKGLPPKLLRPRATRLLARQRLFDKLDRLRTETPLIWVSAPGGSGKTTLISSYIDARQCPAIWYQVDEGENDPATLFHYLGLAAKAVASRRKLTLPSLSPEYLPALGVFTRHYMEALLPPLGADGMLVFDNTQRAPQDAPLYNLLPMMAEGLQPGQCLVVISRHQPPPALLPLVARRQLAELGWEELRFDPEEWLSVAPLLTTAQDDPEALAELYRRSDGWVSALLLGLGSDGSPGRGYDYIDGEFFADMTAEQQELLCLLALFEHIEPDCLAPLASPSQLSALLGKMVFENRFVLHKGQGYAFHPLFQEFLREEGRRRLEPPRRREAQRLAARCALLHDDFAPALAIYRELDEMGELTQVVLDHAEGLLAQGRLHTLAALLQALPGSLRATEPGLLFYQAQLLVMSDASAALTTYRHAARLFLAQGEVSAGYRALLHALRLITTGYYNFEQLPDLLEEVAALQRSHPLPKTITTGEWAATMAKASLIGERDHEQARYWIRLCERELAQSSTPAQSLELAATLLFIELSACGDSARAAHLATTLEGLLRGGNLPPIALIPMRLFLAVNQLYHGSPSQGLQQLDALLDYSREQGGVIFEPMLQLMRGKALIYLRRQRELEPQLQRLRQIMPPDANHASNFHLTAAQAALLEEDFAGALQEIEAGLDATKRAAAPFGWQVVLEALRAEILLRLGRNEESRASVDNSLTQLAGQLVIPPRVHLLLVRAALEEAAGERARSLATLTEAFALIREHHTRRHAGWSASLTSWACRQALAHGVETAIVTRYVRESLFLLEQPPQGLTAWPWPVRITTLGGFAVSVDGHPLQGSGRQDPRSLQLLALIVAHGGEVALREVFDALYPKLDEAHQHSALRNHLHRLRTLLGSEEAVERLGERLRLNRRLCWVDADAFEELLSEQVSGMPGARRQALALYRGEYLPGRQEEYEVLVRREALRGHYLRAVLEAVDSGQGPLPEAIGLCHQALKYEPLAESLYQRLITLYREQGGKELAFATYEQCRRQLAHHLEVDPSAETNRLAGLLQE